MKHLFAPFYRLTFLLLMTGCLLFAQSSAHYSGLNTATQGAWTGVYGSDGYLLAPNVTNLAPTNYAQIAFNGVSTYTWVSQVTRTSGYPNALQISANSASGTAAQYYGNSFSIDVTLTDGKSHQLALYLLDWDTSARAETITINDATSGTQLDQESFSGFHNGEWAVWTISGNVVINVASTTVNNATISGIFFDTPGSQQQQQQITFNTIPTQTVNTPLTLTATASSGLPVTYSASPSTVCTVSGTTATFATAGTCTIVASQAGNNSSYAAAPSVSQSFSVSGGSSGGNKAYYSGPNTTLQGAWTGVYGSDGYLLAPNVTNLAPTNYAQIAFNGVSTYTWVSQVTRSSGYPNALQISANSASGTAAQYYGNSFSIDVTLTDGKSHQLALYLLDWDTSARAETITINDATTGTQLDQESFSSFHNGEWAVWSISGSVVINVVSTTANNATISGIFFDTPGSGSSQQQQQITFNTIPTQTVGTPLTLTATASSGLPVAYNASPSTVCTVSGTTATFATAGTCTIVASQAGNNSSYAAAPSVSQSFSVSGGSSGGNKAYYSGPNTTLQGAWTGVYGSDGYLLAPNVTNLAPTNYAQIAFNGVSTYTWVSQVTRSSGYLNALQISANSATGTAAQYYGNSFSIDVTLTDGKSHQLALYLLDWDTSARAETITINDATTGNQLDQESFSGFHNGEWAVWSISGSVVINVVSTTANNATISGIFFDTPGSQQQQQQITFNTIPTQTVNTPLTLTATASSGLPVAYNASPATVCTVSGTTATFATAGTCTIVASQAGNNSSYAAATPVSQTFAVNNGNGGGGGGSGSSSTASASYQGPPDAGTQGAWPGKYGASGYQIANVNTQAAPNVNVAVTGAATYTWAPQSTDPRALMASPSATTGIASQFFGNSFSINVSITDGHTYPVALYLLDYDGYSRSETITVTTADGSNTPLGPSQTFSNFHNGVWAVWNISGSVIIQVTNALSYGNATVSGVFIGTDPPNQYSILQINAGGGANGTWLADEYYSGGTTYSVSSAISTANVSNPAPQGVYQSQRSASVGTQSNETLVYTIPNLVAGAPYTVHLHFAEIYWQSAGQRVFNVVINSNLVLQNFDIIAAAGCANCAIVKSFAATADSNGNITITFQPVKDLPAINGIEIAPVQVTLLLSNGQWLTQNLGQSGTAEFISSAGIAASGDYDGDGLIDPVTFVSSSAPPTFNATLSSNGATFPYYLGIAGDVAVPGDYDGDGKTDFAVFRPSDSHWYYVPSGTPGGSPVGVPTQELSSDIPLPGDYDGDGKTDIVYFRPGTATFYFTVLSATPGVTHNPITLGKLGDVPVVGDYDGDGRTDLAVFRPSTGEWAYLLSSNPNVVRTQLTQGLPGDVAVPGDYDGDGRTDFAFWRPSNQTWYVILTSNPGQTFNSKFTGTSNNIGDLNYATPFSLAPFAKAPGVNLAARQTANSQYTISGTVLLPDGATPLQGVAVTASTQYSSLQVTTDKAGAYSFTLPANSTLTLSLSLANYTFSSSLYATSPGPMLSGNVAQNFTATVSGTPGTPMSQTISFPSIPTQTVGTPLSLNASASSGLTVMFRSDTTSVCTVNGATASFLMAGTCTIEASQSGNSSYAPATSVPETFTVSAVSVPGSLNPTAPLKEYIFLNGQVIAIEHAH